MSGHSDHNASSPFRLKVRHVVCPRRAAAGMDARVARCDAARVRRVAHGHAAARGGVVLRRPVRAAARAAGQAPHFDIGWPALGERVVARTPFCDLRRFTRADAQRTVLLCAPLAGHAARRDDAETVETLLADGDVCVTDWRNARDVPLASGRFADEYVATLDGFVDGRARRPAAACRRRVPGDRAGARRARAAGGARSPRPRASR